MTEREKLIELFVESAAMDYKDSAEYFLANGVTFAKDTNVPTWIPVSERLPGVYKAVIVCTEFHEIGEAQYNGKHFEWIDDEGDYDHAHVTHWMPLPQPPKENK